jgi:acetylornithine deacetylase/succinyl-diaminopimelate desuccinylase-like protein
MNLSTQNLQHWYEANQSDILKDFFTFLRFKGISTDPVFHNECRATAEFLVSYLQQIGMKATLWENPGLPVVFAEHYVGASRPTVLIYQHYDVQPVDPIELWDTDPFDPQIRQGKVYARGASDNKGQCFATLTALKAVLELSKNHPVNIKLFIEGEEESGGAGTAITLEEKKEKLRADYALVVDFDMPRQNQPGITLGMRGIATFNIECQNGRQDLHSGVHGGIALNPLRALCDVFSKMWDANGTIAIDHFYDDIHPFSKQQLERVNLSFDQSSYERDFGVRAFCNEKDRSIKESNWLRPSLEINGLWGGYTGPGFKTVIPAKAYAKLSCRLIAGQDPDRIEELVRTFLQKNIASGMDVQLTAHHSAKAFCISPDEKIVGIIAQSQRDVFGVDSEFTLCGASVPIVTTLAEITGAEVALFGTSLSSDDFHSPNEHFGLDRFRQGFLTMGRILAHLGE